MLLQIAHREREGIAILDLNGYLTLGQEDLKFRNELDRLITARATRAVLNLSGLRKLDRAGMGTLLFAQARLREAGGNLTVFIAKPSHVELVTEAHLEAVFEVFHDEQDAINSFFPGRSIQRYDVLEYVNSNLPETADSPASADI
jgi:anti-sigma B factor antagonist